MAASGVHYHRIDASTAALLDRVAAEVFDAPIEPARLASYVETPGHHLLVAVDEGLVVGQCAAVVHRHPDTATELYIDNLGVAPSHRRRGVASGLVRRMFEIGRREGCEEAWVGTEVDNLPARRLYETRGAAAEGFVMYVYRL